MATLFAGDMKMKVIMLVAMGHFYLDPTPIQHSKTSSSV